MKKNINYTNCLHPKFYKKLFKKQIPITPIGNLKQIMINYTNNNLFSLNRKINITELTEFSTFNPRKLKKIVLNNRKFFKLILLKKKLVISQKLSNIINKKAKNTASKLILNFEYIIFNIVLRSNIIKSFEDLLILIKFSRIYLNRKYISNINIILGIGDVVEIYLSSRMFNYNNYFKKLFKKSLIKIKYKL